MLTLNFPCILYQVTRVLLLKLLNINYIHKNYLVMFYCLGRRTRNTITLLDLMLSYLTYHAVLKIINLLHCLSFDPQSRVRSVQIALHLIAGLFCWSISIAKIMTTLLIDCR